MSVFELYQLKKSFKKLKTSMVVTAVFSAEDIMDQIQEQDKV